MLPTMSAQLDFRLQAASQVNRLCFPIQAPLCSFSYPMNMIVLRFVPPLLLPFNSSHTLPTPRWTTHCMRMSTSDLPDWRSILATSGVIGTQVCYCEVQRGDRDAHDDGLWSKGQTGFESPHPDAGAWPSEADDGGGIVGCHESTTAGLWSPLGSSSPPKLGLRQAREGGTGMMKPVVLQQGWLEARTPLG